MFQVKNQPRTTRTEPRNNRSMNGFPPEEIPVRDTEILSYSPDSQAFKVKPNRLEPQNQSQVISGNNISKNQNLSYPLNVMTAAKENQSNNSGKGGQNPNDYVMHSDAPNQTMKSLPNMSEFMLNLWKNQRMCDMVIHVNGKDLMIHKIALAAHSDKFAALYCERLPAAMSEINLSSSSAAAVEEILRFIYTSELNITTQNVDSLLACSKQLGVNEVFQRCKNYLLNFNQENVLFFLMIAEKHGIDDVISQIEFFICEQFTNISKSPMFLGLSIEHVKYVLNKENIRVGSELEIFFAALSWIDHNRQDRMQYAVELMECVRFVHISPEDLVTHVESVVHIFAVTECKDMLYRAFRYHSLAHSGSPVVASIRIPNRRRYGGVPSNVEQANSSLNSVTPNTLTTPERTVAVLSNTGLRTPNRSPSAKYDIHRSSMMTLTSPPAMPIPPKPATFVVIGGVNPFSTDSDISCRLVEQYNPKTNSWHLLASLPVPRHHLGAALLDGCLYVVGGSVLNQNDPGNLANPTDVCFRFEPVGKYWTRIASLRKARMYLSVAVLEGVLYAVGGSDTYGRSLASVEYYNPDNDTWGVIEPMSESKIGPAAIGYHGLLYVIGGYLETQNQKVVLDMVECYDPRLNSWIPKKPVPVPCCHANAVEVNDVLYLVGGSTIKNGNVTVSSMSTIFRYYEEEDRWELFENMHIARHDAGSSALGSKIFIVGGVSSVEGHTLSDVECLDVESQTWIEGIDPMTHPALGLTCCTFSGDEGV